MWLAPVAPREASQMIVRKCEQSASSKQKRQERTDWSGQPERAEAQKVSGRAFIAAPPPYVTAADRKRENAASQGNRPPGEVRTSRARAQRLFMTDARWRRKR